MTLLWVQQVAPSPIGGKPTLYAGKPKDGAAPQAAAGEMRRHG